MRMGGFFSVVLFSVAATAIFPQDAQAQNLGNVFDNIILAWRGLPGFLMMVCYIAGLFLAVHSILKFKDHVDNPNQTKISEGVKRMIAGGMFLAAPSIGGAVQGSLFSAGNTLASTGWGGTNPVDPDTLDGMVVTFITNISGPAAGLLMAFCYISGIALLMVGISRLTKRMEEGPRGPAGVGTFMTFIASGMLMTLGSSVGSFVTSLFGDDQLMTQATIDPGIGLDAVDADRIQTVIEGLMIFIMLVGYIAFIRGWFVLKAFADGQQGATLAQGLTFLFGGTLAINLGELVNVLQATAGFATNGITFG
jgi:hypothetical protein